LISGTAIATNVLREENLYAIMAGVGNPYAVLSPLCMKLLRALHDGLKLDEIGHLFDLYRDRLPVVLEPLEVASLVSKNSGVYRSSFLIADAQETG
jgi:hypothetical protein